MRRPNRGTSAAARSGRNPWKSVRYDPFNSSCTSAQRFDPSFDRMMDTEHLSIEKREGLLWIRFERAEKANALTAGMMEGAAAALDSAASDEAVRATLIVGAGEKVFCAGVDVREKPADSDMAAHRKRRSAALSGLLNGVLDTPKPVIAVLNGIASGGGAMLALLADARVAVDSAELSLPEINLGMPTFPGAAIAMHVGGLALAT